MNFFHHNNPPNHIKYILCILDRFCNILGFFFWLFSRLSARTIKSKKVQFQKVSYAIFFFWWTNSCWMEIVEPPSPFFLQGYYRLFIWTFGKPPPPLCRVCPHYDHNQEFFESSGLGTRFTKIFVKITRSHKREHKMWRYLHIYPNFLKVCQG